LHTLGSSELSTNLDVLSLPRNGLPFGTSVNLSSPGPASSESGEGRKRILGVPVANAPMLDPADKFIPLNDGFIGGVVPKLFLLQKYQSKHGREETEGKSSAFHLFLCYKLF
jgi:hypothetical protein